MAALAYVDVPGYSALILMRSFTDLSLPKAGISRSHEWLDGTAAKWSEKRSSWLFPSGATLTFGYVEEKGSEQHYRTAEFHYIAFDELTRFDESQYTFLFSRLRRLKGSDVPTRMRAATNPGGRGHDWVRRRFIPQEFYAADPEERFGRPWKVDARIFVPARLEDNPTLDRVDYEESLSQLESVTRAQLRHGDWQAHAGGRFKKEWWRRYRDNGDHWLLLDTGDIVIKHETSLAAVMDPANRKTKSSKYTAIGLFGDAGLDRVLVLDVIRQKLELTEVIPTLNSLCGRWEGVDWVGIEANGFQRMLVNEARDSRKYRHIPTVREFDPEGKSKLTRATPAILRAEAGLIYLPEEAEWLEDFEAELQQFTGDDKEDAFSDQVDVLSYFVLGVNKLAGSGAMPFVSGHRSW